MRIQSSVMTVIQTINQYWGIILFILGLGFHVLWTYWTVGNHTKQIKDLNERIISIEARNATRDRESDTFREQMMVTMQEVKTTLSYIKEALSRLERK